MKGLELLKTLVEATELPSDLIERELRILLAKRNLNPETLTLADIREVVASYLQETLVNAKASPEKSSLRQS